MASSFHFDAYRLEPQVRRLTCNGAPLTLPPKAFDTLLALVERRDRVVTKDELIAMLWPDTIVEEANLFQNISIVRKVLGTMPNGQSYIATIPKRGYQFVGRVEYRPDKEAAHFVPRPASQRPRRWAKPFLIGVTVVAVGVASAVVFLRPASQQKSYPILHRLTTEPGWAVTPAISPDGKWVVYSDCLDGEWRQLYRQSTEAGPTQQLTSDASDHTDPTFSPDGRRVFYRSSANGGRVGSVMIDGQNSHVLNRFHRGRHPRVAPDGIHLAYWIPGNEETLDLGATYVRRLDVEESLPTRVFPDFALAIRPLWSEDGRFLLASGTWHSGIPDREFDAWVVGFQNGSQQGAPIKTGLFPLLLSEGVYRSLSERSQISITDWRDGYLYFSALAGNSSEIWRVRLTGRDFLARGPIERLTVGTGQNEDARVNSNGAMVFSSRSVSFNVYRLPLTGEQREVKLTDEPNFNFRPFIDTSARYIAMESSAPGHKDRILFFDLMKRTRREFGHIRPDAISSHATISPGGRFVAYRVLAGNRQEIWVEDTSAPLGTAAPRRVCEDCGSPMQWLSDSTILFQTDEIATIDVHSGRRRPFLRRPGTGIFSPRVKMSTDGSGWVVFYTHALDSQKTQLMVARVANSAVEETNQWNALPSGSSAIDTHPAWASDGKRIFFISDRDGHRCIWAMEFEAASGVALAPNPVKHFHKPDRTIIRSTRRGTAGLTASPTDLFLALEEAVSSIWITRVEK